MWFHILEGIKACKKVHNEKLNKFQHSSWFDKPVYKIRCFEDNNKKSRWLFS